MKESSISDVWMGRHAGQTDKVQTCSTETSMSVSARSSESERNGTHKVDRAEDDLGHERVADTNAVEDGRAVVENWMRRSEISKGEDRQSRIKLSQLTVVGTGKLLSDLEHTEQKGTI